MSGQNLADAEIIQISRMNKGPMLNRTSLFVWICILLVAHFLVLFVLVHGLSSRLMPLYNQDKDVDGYNLLAANLESGHGYRFFPDTAPTLMREPGYPFLLAGIFDVFGVSIRAVQIVNVCFTICSAFLIALLVGRLSSEETAIFIAPMLFLFHPGTLIAESRAGVESTFTLLLAVFMLLLHRANQSRRSRDHAIAGAVLGVAILVRSTPILFAVALVLYQLVFERGAIKTRVILRNFAVMVGAILIVLSPWVIRNYRLTGRFVPTASVLGVSAQAGQYICQHLGEGRPWYLLDREASRQRGAIATGLGYKLKAGEEYYQFFYNPQDELNFSSYLFHKVVTTYHSSPSLCLKCMSFNLANFWIAGKNWQSRLLNCVVQLPLLICAVWGFIICRRGNRCLGTLMMLLILYSMAVSVPILAQARYSVPLLPLTASLSAVALSTWLHGLRKGSIEKHPRLDREATLLKVEVAGSKSGLK
jgi:hypothetical protein